MSLGLLDLSLGAIEVAVLMASLLYGMSLVQTYIYAITSQGDRAWLKAIVAAVCVFETLHTISVWAYLYNLTVAQFGNPLALFELPWYFCVSITLQAVAGGLVQAFYVWRVYIVSQKWWLATPPALGALVRTVIAVIITVLSMRVGNLPVFRDRYSYTVFIAVISSAFADLWNTAALCWFLRSRSTVHTRGAVNRVIIWAIETGLVTSVAALCLIVFWVTMPGNGLWVAALLVYAKLYSNSLLVSLNARSSVKATLSSSGQNLSRSQTGAGPILITRTRNYEVSGAQESLPGKSEYDSDALAISMTDFSSKRQIEHPFASC